LNHLAHFKVAHPDPDLLVGGFLGDFIKGRLKGEYPERVEAGIRLHRAVDAFADKHPVARQSSARFSKPFRRYGPILVDIIYDYALARAWDRYHDQDIRRFGDEVFDALERSAPLLPDPARQVAGRMNQTRSIEHYDEETFVERSFASIARRLKRDNPVDRAFGEFLEHRDELCEDFSQFFPDLVSFCEEWQ
jgi:acyl carrier protein phosphodiesterase